MSSSCVAHPRVIAVSLLSVLTAGIVVDVHVHAQDQAQTKAKEEPRLGWSNTSDLSLVVVEGNSQSTTLGLSDNLKYVWKNARLEFEVTVVRANKSDDRFFLVEPGIEFPLAAHRRIRRRPSSSLGRNRMSPKRDIFTAERRAVLVAVDAQRSHTLAFSTGDASRSSRLPARSERHSSRPCTRSGLRPSRR